MTNPSGQTSRHLYDEQYRRISTAPAPSPSLISFLKSEPLNNWISQQMNAGPWCELGCGAQSLFENIDLFLPGHAKADCVGFDFSKEAIALSPRNSVRYEVTNLLEGIPGEGYSFILDGHFLHCLDSLPHLYQMLGHIARSLKPGGIFAAEVMMAHKMMSFDVDYNFDFESSVLYQQDGIAARIILEARVWEDLLKNTGLKLEFFVCQSSIKMIPSADRSTPMQGDPECLRFVLRRPEQESKGDI